MEPTHCIPSELMHGCTEIPVSFITDPRKFFEFPFILMEQIGSFTMSIMQQSFEFASSIGRLMV